ncbi:solute carrier family 22 member 15-like [Liolophura sinensis]|uniref:solute carrier family 22 member 15-like n=1 Tax=Liolophura sinensis TaxID=3198878 RepID=UPI00315903B7
MDQIACLLEQPGKWQTKQIAVILLGIFSTAVNTLAIAFIGFQPKFACTDGENDYNYTGGRNATTEFNDHCTVLNATSNTSSACGGGFRYQAYKLETIVAEWDLVCEKAYLSEVSQVLYTVGMAIGSLFVSPISDRLGRKKSYLGLRFLYVFCTVGLALSPNVYVFMALRFLTGAMGTCPLVRFVYLMELSPIHHRPFLTTMTGILWAVILCLESGIAQLMRGMNWRYFQAVISITSLSVILDVIFIKESLLWLYANDKLKEASKLLKKAMATNGIMEQEMTATDDGRDSSESTGDQARGYRMVPSADTPPAEAKDNQYVNINSPSESRGCDAGGNRMVPLANNANSKDSPALVAKTGTKRLSIIHLLKNRSTRKIVFIICFTWFVNSLVYYGIFLMSYAMAGDRILNFFLGSLVEIPSYLALYVGLRWLDRKKLLVWLHGLCAVSLLLAGVFNFTLTGVTKVIVMQVVTFVGKFGISATFTLIYVYTTEVFPTNFRTSGLGIGSISARLGSFLSPFSSVLVRKLPWGPGIIFGGLCLVLTFILLFAPETRNRALPHFLEDIEAWESDEKRASSVREEGNASTTA